MTFMHIGKDFVPPDVEDKVTGDAKYVEDFAPEGKVYARLLTSPLPSGRVVSIDASEALRMDGVLGILTADDLPPSNERRHRCGKLILFDAFCDTNPPLGGQGTVLGRGGRSWGGGLSWGGERVWRPESGF